MAESKEELKSLLITLKEESETASLKLNIQKVKIMTSGPITSWQIDGETMETVDSLEAAQGAPRDPRRDSRGERSPWLPLETRPDSRGSLECNPEIPAFPGEEY